MIATSGFLTALNCAKFVFGRGSAPDPTGELIQRSPDPLASLMGPMRRGGEGQGKGRGNGAEGNAETPLSHIPGPAPVDVAVYTALVLVTDCNISLLPARPYFSAEYQRWRAMTGSGCNYFLQILLPFIIQT